MKLVIYAMNYAPEIAGVGRVNGEIAEFFAGLGADVTVVTTPPHYPGWVTQQDYSNFRYQWETLNGVRIIRCPLWLHRPMRGFWRLIAPTTFALSSAPCAIWQIVAGRPDIVLCIEPTLLAAPIARWAAALAGAKSVLHVQDLEVDASFAAGHLAGVSWMKRAAFRFERHALRGFDAVVTISGRMAERLVVKGVARERLKVIRNWVDLEFIKPLGRSSGYRADLGLSPSQTVVLYSGAMGRKQGLETVIAAADRLRYRQDIVFILAGEGPARPQLEAQAAALPNVRFLPFQPYARLSEFLGLADVHVLPQSEEMADLVLPSKLGGMLASGKKVIVTALPETELAEFLDGSAYLSPPGDAASLASTIVAAVTEVDGPASLARRLSLSRRLDRADGLSQFAALFDALAPPSRDTSRAFAENKELTAPGAS